MLKTNKISNAGLSLSIRRGRLIVHHATINALGEPAYIRFLINKVDRRLAVQCCEEIDTNHIQVPAAVEGKDYKFEVSSVELLSIVYKICNWDSNNSYLVYGVIHPRHRLVEFDLDTAVMIQPEQFEEPGIFDAAGEE